MNKTKVFVIFSSIVLVGAGFYFFYLKPQQIKNECYGLSKTDKSFFGGFDVVENSIKEKAIYDECLRKNGL